MSATIRRAIPRDLAAVAPVLYSAFKSISDQYRFPPDFESPEAAHGVASLLLNHPKFYGVVAEDAGRLLGSNFIDLRSPTVGLGPISVDPTVQNKGVGRQLMLAAMGEARRRSCAGIRLVQLAYHNRSLCLYTTLGFHSRYPLSIMQGKPLGQRIAGYEVRQAVTADTDACNALCRRVHGFDRDQEVAESIGQNSLMVIEHLGSISGYTNGVGFFTQATHMTIGLFNEPDGAWLPGVLC
jgi:predicted N-acetyltransferase YhbS